MNTVETEGQMPEMPVGDKMERQVGIMIVVTDSGG